MGNMGRERDEIHVSLRPDDLVGLMAKYAGRAPGDESPLVVRARTLDNPHDGDSGNNPSLRSRRRRYGLAAIALPVAAGLIWVGLDGKSPMGGSAEKKGNTTPTTLPTTVKTEAPASSAPPTTAARVEAPPPSAPPTTAARAEATAPSAPPATSAAPAEAPAPTPTEPPKLSPALTQGLQDTNRFPGKSDHNTAVGQ